MIYIKINNGINKYKNEYNMNKEMILNIKILEFYIGLTKMINVCIKIIVDLIYIVD